MIIEVIAYNYSVFGIINSSLYFVSFLLMYINRSRLKSLKFNIEKKEKITAKRFLKDTIENLKIIRSNKKIYRFVLLFAILNLYSSGMYAIFLLVGNYANTLTVPIDTIIFTFLSNVIGNMFTISILLAVLVFSLLYTYTFILNEKQKYSPKI